MQMSNVTQLFTEQKLSVKVSFCSHENSYYLISPFRTMKYNCKISQGLLV